MKTLIFGASGATGQKLVEQMLKKNQEVKIVVRSAANLPDLWKENGLVQIIETSVLDISLDEMAEHLKDCDAVASCLGHNLSLKGMYGKPRKLVRDALILACNAIKKNGEKESPTKFVLMNTTGNRNRDLNETISFAQKIVLALIRILVPPHRDNEEAADCLRKEIGQENPLIEWAAVRPDTLINEDISSEYKIYPSPTRSAIFDAGKTSRINVAHFMSELITDLNVWRTWKGQMPVIYNANSEKVATK
jgi:hypothetical protein